MPTTSTGPNHSLFVDVLAQIEREPQTWRQAMWRTDTPCGTSYCFAGHAVNIAEPQAWVGAEPLTPGRSMREFYLLGDKQFAGDRARQLLGIDDKPAGDLFMATNSLADLYRISAEVLGVDEQTLREKVAAVVADGAVQAVSA